MIWAAIVLLLIGVGLFSGGNLVGIIFVTLALMVALR
jgi:hypothetical protein